MLFIDQVGDMDIVGLAQRAADGIELAFAAGFDVFLSAVDGEGDAALPCVAASAEVEVGEGDGGLPVHIGGLEDALDLFC